MEQEVQACSSSSSIRGNLSNTAADQGIMDKRRIKLGSASAGIKKHSGRSSTEVRRSTTGPAAAAAAKIRARPTGFTHRPAAASGGNWTTRVEPRIMHVLPPPVIHAEPGEFMQVVQRLTGRPQKQASCSRYVVDPSEAEDDVVMIDGGDCPTAVRLSDSSSGSPVCSSVDRQVVDREAAAAAAAEVLWSDEFLSSVPSYCWPHDDDEIEFDQYCINAAAAAAAGASTNFLTSSSSSDVESTVVTNYYCDVISSPSSSSPSSSSFGLRSPSAIADTTSFPAYNSNVVCSLSPTVTSAVGSPTYSSNASSLGDPAAAAVSEYPYLNIFRAFDLERFLSQ